MSTLLTRPRETLKVPRVTPWFWSIKILSTAMGEACSDWLAHRFNPFVAAGVGFVVFAVAITIQFRSERYRPWMYWTAVSSVAIFGTMAADGLHVEFGVPYIASTVLYAVILTAVFIAWHRSEKTLSIHSIHTPRREIFYWLAVLATFAMGTALGDLTAFTWHWGFVASALVFCVLILLPLIGWRALHFNAVATFWTAYVLTRPLGASWADWFDNPKSVGGLGVGRFTVAFVLALVIAALVWWMERTGIDTPHNPPDNPGPSDPPTRFFFDEPAVSGDAGSSPRTSHGRTAGGWEPARG